jgi:hypothetical protein
MMNVFEPLKWRLFALLTTPANSLIRSTNASSVGMIPITSLNARSTATTCLCLSGER